MVRNSQNFIISTIKIETTCFKESANFAFKTRKVKKLQFRFYNSKFHVFNLEISILKLELYRLNFEIVAFKFLVLEIKSWIFTLKCRYRVKRIKKTILKCVMSVTILWKFIAFRIRNRLFLISIIRSVKKCWKLPYIANYYSY